MLEIKINKMGRRKKKTRRGRMAIHIRIEWKRRNAKATIEWEKSFNFKSRDSILLLCRKILQLLNVQRQS